MSNFIGVTVRLSEDTMKLLKARSIQTNESVAIIVRRAVVQVLSQETVKENAPAIAIIGREITRNVEGVVQKESDRLARLVVKTMKAAAASMYLAAQAAGGTEAPKRLDDALGMAVKYIKLPDAETAGKAEAATAAGDKPASEPEWESCGITDEELFDL